MFSIFSSSQPTAQDRANLEVQALTKELDAANKAFKETNRDTANEAERRYRQVLNKAKEARLDPEDPQLLCANANLGLALRLQGKVQAAGEQFQTTLAQCEKVEARFVCQLKMNIALSFQAQHSELADRAVAQQDVPSQQEVRHKFEQAYAEAQKLLRNGELKPDDYMLLTFQQSYGDFLLEMNELDGERMWREVVERKERLFGLEDHRTLACKQALAESLALVQVPRENKNNDPGALNDAGMRVQAPWAQSHLPANRAAALLLEVLEVRERTEVNSDLIENTQVKLAELLMNEVQPPELTKAEGLLHKALQRRVDRVGFEDRTVADLYWILGACQWRVAHCTKGASWLPASSASKDKRKDSEQAFRTCWKMREKVLGEDHSETRKAKLYYDRVVKKRQCCVLL